MRPKHPALLYDDGCTFCRACASAFLRADRHATFDFVPLSDPLAARLLVPMTADERLESIHMVEPDGTVTSAGPALLRLLDGLPAWSWMGRVTRAVPPIAAAVSALYDFVAPRRGSLARYSPRRAPVRRWRGSADASGASVT